MKRYLYLQFKRASKIFPSVLAVAIALLIGLSLVLFGVLNNFNNRDENKRYSIAITGDIDSEYVSWGISALQSFDDTKFTIDFVEMTEPEAHSALEKGDISAYVVLPEDFAKKAISGNIEPITYVTTTGIEGVNSLFKKELTTLVTDMVIYSQKGAYGVGEALDDKGLDAISNQHTDKISFEYADLIFHRSDIYNVNEIGVSDGLSTVQYYICSIIIVLTVLVGIPFASMYIKKDYTFNRLLLSRGYSCGKQLLCEYVAHLISMFLLSSIIILTIVVVGNIVPEIINSNLMFEIPGEFILKIIPVIIMVASFNIMMFELSSNLVSGMLIHFFAIISLCYISGCMYPVYALPKVMGQIASFLPIGIARIYLATGFTYESSSLSFVGLLLYGVGLYLIAWIVRFCKTTKVRG